jgi:hypothetical protein
VLLNESVCSRCTPLNSCHDHVSALGYDLEEYPPVSNPATKARKSLQLADVAL